MPIITWVTVSLILSITGLALWLWWAWKSPGARGYAAAPVSWLLNVFAFAASFVVLSSLGRMDKYFYNTWAQVIYIHGLLLLVGAAVIILMDGRVFIWMLFGKRRE